MQINPINKQEIVQATDECVMCGLCLPHCPTYKIAMLEPESPRGRIALVRGLFENKLQTNETIRLHLDHCLTCMKCENVCPANVDYEKIIDAGRAITDSQQSLSKKLQQSFLLFLLSNTSVRQLFKLLISTSRALGVTRLLGRLRLFSLLSSKSQTHTITLTSSSTGPRVALLNSCASDLLNDETYSNAELILAKLGFDVVKFETVQCCGALHQHSGDHKSAEALKDKFIAANNSIKTDYLVSLATGCGAYVKHFENKLDSKFVDVNELVLQQLENKNFAFKPLAKKILAHEPCSQPQTTNVTNLLKRLLHFIPEIEIIEFNDETACCGAGGLNTLKYSQLANQLIADKVAQIKHSNVSYLTSSNIGCAMHFQAQLKQENIPVQVCHPITLLAQQML